MTSTNSSESMNDNNGIEIQVEGFHSLDSNSVEIINDKKFSICWTELRLTVKEDLEIQRLFLRISVDS